VLTASCSAPGRRRRGITEGYPIRIAAAPVVHHPPTRSFAHHCRDLTRGQGTFSPDKMRQFVRSEVRGKAGIPDAAAETLEHMRPSTYLGISPQLAKAVRSRLK